jgi:hypothetical protein
VVFPLGNLALDQYVIRVSVDSIDEWSESNENNNSLDSAQFPYGVLSGKLSFGEIDTNLQSGLLNHSPGNCSTSLSLSSANGHWNIEGDWPQAPYSTSGELCVNSVTSADDYSLDLSVVSGSLVDTGIINSTATIRGFGIRLTGTSLGSDGLDVDEMVLTMPDTISIHKEMVLSDSNFSETTWVNPQGSSTLIMHPDDQVAHPELIVGLYEAGTIFFHDYSLPFYVRVDSVNIDFSNENGLRLIGVSIEGVHHRAGVNMVSNDPRKVLYGLSTNGVYEYGMFPDNRNLFYNASPDSEIFINGEGIQGSFSFEGSAALNDRGGTETSFPRGKISWRDFDVIVQNGEIQQAPIAIDSFDMAFSTACPDNTCNEKVRPMAYSFHDMDGTVASDGALGIRTGMSGNTNWGKYNSQVGEIPPQYTFERADLNSSAFLYLPGSVMTGSNSSPGTPEQHTVFQYLLGSRNYTDDSSLVANTLNYLNSAQSRKGNDYFAGLTLGPQYLLNENDDVEQGLTEILEQQQHILFNGQTVMETFEIYPYCKYVLRPGGLTGVFNLVTPSASEGGKSIEIYGYELFMHRFAFRQVLNTIDKRTFIDGKLDLPHPAEVTPYFVDLDLSCSGDFGQGEVDSEENCDGVDDAGDGDGIADEGCYQNYSYWNIPINYLAIGFAPDDPYNLCGNRQLSLTVSQHFDRLNKKLQHTAFWNTQGEPDPSKESMSGPAELMVDTPESGGKGFPVQVHKGYLNRPASYSGQVDGFANIVSQIGLPLFNAPVAHTHLRNSKDNNEDVIAMFKDETQDDGDRNGVPDNVAYGTVENYRNMSKSKSVSISPDPRLRAKYNWPSSNGLKLDYPLNYQPAQSNKVPRFNGVKQETSFINSTVTILKTNTVPNYLEPENLKISMGVSANTAFLKDLTLDIRSPKDVNDFFNTLDPPLNINVNQYIGSLSASSKKMDSMTGGDLTPFFRGKLTEDLDSGATSLAMKNMAESLSTIQTSPHALRTLLTSRVDGLIKAVAQRTGSSASTLTPEKLSYLYDNLAACTLFAGDARQQASLLQEIEDGNVSIPNELTRDIVEEYFRQLNGMVQHVSELRDLIARYRTRIKKNHNLVSTLQESISSADVTAPRLALEGALDDMQTYRDNSTNNPFFVPVTTAQDSLEKIRDDLRNVSLVNLGQALKTGASSAGASLDTSQLTDMDRLLESRVDELSILLTKADILLSSGMAGLTFPTLFNSAKTRLQGLETQANLIKTLFNEAAIALPSAFTNIDLILSWYEESLNSMLEVMSQKLDVDMILSSSSSDSWTELTDLGQKRLDEKASADIARAKTILKISPTGSAAHQFVSYWKLFTMIESPLNAKVKNIRVKMKDARKIAETFIPAPRREDIRNIIVADVMNSDPVIGLNTLFHDQFGHMTSYVDMMTGEVTNQANLLIKQTVAAIDDSLQKQLMGEKTVIAEFDDWGISVTGLTGYVTARQNEISRFHLEGTFDIDAKPSSSSYWGALDITSWNAKNGKGSCGNGTASTGLVDVTISTRDVPIKMLKTTVNLKEAMLGFTLDGATPIGIHGSTYLSGEVKFEALILYDMGLEAGIGKTENYFGAKCAGRFDSYQIKAAFYFGKSCGMQVLGRLDPEVADFIGQRQSITGVYARGGTSFPVYDNGCFLRVGVGAEIGAWYFAENPLTYGGLLGGSVYGTVACIGSIKGKLTMIGGKTGDIFKFTGHGWGAAGIGFCSPGSWESVSDSRGDGWCVTGDATFRGKATSKTGGGDVDINIETPDVSCCY